MRRICQSRFLNSLLYAIGHEVLTCLSNSRRMRVREFQAIVTVAFGGTDRLQRLRVNTVGRNVKPGKKNDPYKRCGVQ